MGMRVRHEAFLQGRAPIDTMTIQNRGLLSSYVKCNLYSRLLSASSKSRSSVLELTTHEYVCFPLTTVSRGVPYNLQYPRYKVTVTRGIASCMKDVTQNGKQISIPDVTTFVMAELESKTVDD